MPTQPRNMDALLDALLKTLWDGEKGDTLSPESEPLFLRLKAQLRARFDKMHEPEQARRATKLLDKFGEDPTAHEQALRQALEKARVAEDRDILRTLHQLGVLDRSERHHTMIIDNTNAQIGKIIPIGNVEGDVTIN